MSDPLRFDLNLKIPDPSLPLGAIAQASQLAAAALAGKYPQNELWEITAEHPGAKYTVRNPLGRIMRKVQAVGPAASRLKVGQLAVVGYYDRERQKPYIKAAGGFANWEAIEVLIGEWMQAEGNFCLGQSGKTNIFPAPTSDGAGTVSIFFSNTAEEQDGMSNLLGLVAGAGTDAENETTGIGTLFFIAFLVPNSANTAIESLQIRCYEAFPTYSLKWSLSFPYSAALPANRVYRANLFWDKKARILTAAEGRIWSVLVPTTGNPVRSATTSVSVKYNFSAAGEFGLSWPTPGTIQAYRRNSNLSWSAVGSTFDVSDLDAIQFPSPDTGVSRPWPFDAQALAFRVLLPSSNRQDKLLTVLGKTGSASYISVGTADDGSANVEFSAALDAGDSYMETGFDYSTSFIPNGGDAIGPAFSGFPALYDVDLGAGSIPFQEHVWGGRQDFGRLFIAYPPASYDTLTVWYYDQASGTPSPVNPYPVSGPNAGPESMGFLCPRPRSNDSSPDPDSTYTLTRWPEQPTPQPSSADQLTPCLQEDSSGNLIYGKICAIRASVPNPRPTLTWFQKPGEDTDNGLGGTITYHQSTYTYYHWPRQETIHETFLIRVSPTGSEERLSLSNRFAGLTYDNSDLPSSHFPVTLTEELAVPENIWVIRLGPRAVVGQDDTSWTDTIYALHDWRESADLAPRLRLSVVSKTFSLISVLDGLSPMDVISGGDEDGKYEWWQSDVRMFVNIGTLYQWALIAVYSDNRLDFSSHRVDLHLVNLSSPAAPTIDLSLSETGTTSLPRPEDFDRMAATASGIWWIGRNPADGAYHFWSLIHT